MSKPDARNGVTSSPAGTGHQPGLGEAFSINLNTGQGVYSYKLPLPDGVAGHTPSLALEYAHGTGLGWFGLGWRLPLRSITRRLDFGVPDVGAFERFLDGGTELVELTDGSFATLVETAFNRYMRLAGGGWRIEERNGVVYELGTTAAARIVHPDHPTRVCEYLLERTIDTYGNTVTYDYLIDDGFARIREIRYAAYAVRFTYEARPDARRDGRAGFLRTRTRRCRSIELFLDPGAAERRIRSWTFDYGVDTMSGVSLLAGTRLVSHGPAADGSLDVVRNPVTFGYSAFDPRSVATRWIDAPDGPQPPPLNEPDVALVTLDDAPLPGMLRITNGQLHYWRNRGDGTWAHPVPLRDTPAIDSFADDGVAFVDSDGSGTADMLLTGAHPLHGYYENGGASGWSRFVAYPRGARAVPEWTSGRVRLTDVDGDGLVDAIMSTDRAFAVWSNDSRAGWAAPTLAPKGAAEDRPDVDLDDPLVHLADMTGDGLQDLVRIRSGRIEYWPSLGHGRFGARVVMQHAPRLRDIDRTPQSALFTDIDGDGCADLVRVTAAGIEIWINRNGIEFSDPVVIDTVPAPLPGTLRAVNMNGRTRSALLWNSLRGRAPAYVHTEFGQAQPPYMLAQVDNGAGLQSQITYRWAIDDYLQDVRDDERWQTNLPFPLVVVAGSRETDQITGATNETEYRYHEGHFEQWRRQFQGFKRAERIDRGDASRADTLTVYHYLMGEERAPGNQPEHAALNGLQRRVEKYSLDGTALEGRAWHVEECTYELQVLASAKDGRKRVFVAATSHRTADHERTDDVRVEEKTFTYDALGNVTRERLRGSGTRAGAAVPVRERITDVEYAVNAARWMIDRPSRIIVRDDTGAILTEKRRYYDGADFVGLPLGHVDRGLMTREEQLVMSEAEFQAHYAGMGAAALGYHLAADADGRQARFLNLERRAWAADGVRIAERDPLGEERRFDHDAARLLRVRLTDPLGETRFDYDRASRQPTRIRYPDGTEAHFSYDAQGRVLASVLPGDDATNPPRTFHYNDAVLPLSRTTRFRTSAGAAGVTAAVSYFDGRDRELQQRVVVDAGRVVVSGVAVRNSFGDVAQEFQSFDDTTVAFALPPVAGLPSRRMFFDGRGRVTRTIDYAGGESRAEYQPFEVVLYDANDTDASAANVARGQFDTPRREEFDVFRDRTRIVELLDGGAEVVTRFVIRTDSQVGAIHDARGAVTSCTYDLMGRRLTVDHREAGQRRLWYDARGKVVRMADANGQDLRAEHDALGRLLRLTAGATVLEQYTYDDAARNAHGRIADVTYPGGSQHFTYDAAGRVVQHEHRFDGVAAARTVSYEFDLLGRELAMVHGDGTRIERVLSANGWIRAIPGILDDVTYNARGMPTRVQYANGVITDIQYTDGPGRVNSQRTVGPHGQVMEDITFSYDQLHMLLAQTDTATGGTGAHSFEYDPLYQLRRATSDEGAGAVARQYDYVDHYNLTRFDEGGSVLHYDDAAHPYRVAGITNGAAPRFDTAFDANGNLLSLPGKTFAYNAKHELQRFQSDAGVVAEYRYDHDGRRISKVVDDGQGVVVRTLFIGRDADIRDGAPTYYVYLGDLRVALIRAAGTTFVHSNYLGSTAFFSDAAGVRIAAIAWRPFGNLASSSGAVDLRTFGTHPFDTESGLYYMRRRYYAPEVGRFITPDPLALYQPQNVMDRPRALHPYAYTGNDPLNNADPEGLSFWSVVGAIVGVIAAVAIVALVVMTGGLAGVLLGAGLLIGLVTVSYIVADATAGTGFGEFMRGFMIGLNAGMNAIIATALFGPVIGISLGVINFLAAFDGIAASPVYQGILGWSSWLMPMSWLATGVGLVFFVINVIVAFFTFWIPRWLGGSGWDAARINSVSVDWGTGTIMTHGGLLTPARGGYNLGNFAYVHRDSAFSTSLVQHETGHTLNVAAFGSIFHFVGAIDENVIPGRGAGAYAEFFADSHDPTRTVPDPSAWQEMWV
jgi:RHS repeat-associated protein